MSQVKPKKFQANIQDIIKLCDEYDLHPCINKYDTKIGIALLWHGPENIPRKVECSCSSGPYNIEYEQYKYYDNPKGTLPQYIKVNDDDNICRGYSPLDYTINDWTITHSDNFFFYHSICNFILNWKASHPKYGYVKVAHHHNDVLIARNKEAMIDFLKHMDILVGIDPGNL